MFLDVCDVVYRQPSGFSGLDDYPQTIALIDDPNYALDTADWPIGTAYTDAATRATAYDVVIQALPVTVRASTPAQATHLANILVNLLDSARRWNDGARIVSAVLRVRAAGASSMMSSVILGLAQPVVIPTPQMQPDGNYALRLDIQIERRGRWVDAHQVDGAVDGSNTEIYQTTTVAGCGVIATPSRFTGRIPTIIEPGGVSADSDGASTVMSAANLPIIMVVGRRWDGVTGFGRAGLLRAGNYTASGAWSTTSGAAALAVGSASSAGTLWRYTPAGTSASLSPSASLYIDPYTAATGFLTYTARALIAMTVRNNGATVYQVRAAVIDAYTGEVSYTPYITIDASSANPRAFILGIASTRYAVGAVALEVTASAAASTIDFDGIYVVDVGDPGGAAIVIDSFVGASAILGVFAPEMNDLTPTMDVSSGTTPGVVPVVAAAYRGGSILGGLDVHRAEMSAALLAPTSTYFQLQKTGPVVTNITWRFFRRPAALIPE